MINAEKMVKNANFDVSWRMEQVVKSKVMLESSPSKENQDKYDYHMGKLTEEMAYRQALCEMLNQHSEPVEIPSIGKWAMGL